METPDYLKKRRVFESFIVSEEVREFGETHTNTFIVYKLQDGTFIKESWNKGVAFYSQYTPTHER